MAAKAHNAMSWRALPTGVTPSMLLHSVRLESNSTGSSFPLKHPSPFPWKLVHQPASRDSRNLVDPFMRVNNQSTRHLAALRES